MLMILLLFLQEYSKLKHEVEELKHILEQHNITAKTG
jgi:hypothetical protein